MDSDHRYARLVADEAPNIVHEEVHFTFKEGLEVLPRVVTAMETTDASMIRAGVPLYLLSKHISARGFKVVLCGEGADESMAGYRLFVLMIACNFRMSYSVGCSASKLLNCSEWTGAHLHMGWKRASHLWMYRS